MNQQQHTVVIDASPSTRNQRLRTERLAECRLVAMHHLGKIASDLDWQLEWRPDAATGFIARLNRNRS